MAYALGIDVGGTKILAGVIDLDNGQVVCTAKKKTRVGSGPDDLVQRIAEVGKEAIEQAHSVKKVPIGWAGIGIAGQVDRDRGLLIRGPNLGANVTDLPLAKRVGDTLGLKVKVANDVEVGTLGEQRFGAGHGHDDFVCIFVGTGIGGGIVQAGKLRHGASDSAGEIGHAVVAYDGRLCGCGGRGHLEAYAARSAITKVLVEELKRGRESSLRAALPNPLPEGAEGTLIRSQMIAQAVLDGDPLAVEAVTDGARYLAAGLIAIINFYNPPRIVLGGGLVDAVELYFKVAARRAQEESLVVTRGKVKIVRAKLGDNAGIIGAALLTSQG
ncbi:MAG TPA: ROK family protein [Chloroflexota bacterium]|nr:ROK family protein [Chloroflexota bacterium]